VIRTLLILVALTAVAVALVRSGWLDDRAPVGSTGRAPVTATGR
jgi:hypothetical protein